MSIDALASRRENSVANSLYFDDSTVGGGRPQLVLNYRSVVVRRILARSEPEVVELAIESLYGRALLRGYHPIRPADAELLDRSFLGLLDRAFP